MNITTVFKIEVVSHFELLFLVTQLKCDITTPLAGPTLFFFEIGAKQSDNTDPWHRRQRPPNPPTRRPECFIVVSLYCNNTNLVGIKKLTKVTTSDGKDIFRQKTDEKNCYFPLIFHTETLPVISALKKLYFPFLKLSA